MFFSHLLDEGVAFGQYAGDGIDGLPMHRAPEQRLRLDHHHPQLSFFEAALFLNDFEQACFIQMAVAEVPAERESGDNFAFHPFIFVDVVHGVGDRVEQGLALKVREAGGRSRHHDGFDRERVIDHALELFAHRARRLLELV